jgi:hypothetical protein
MIPTRFRGLATHGVRSLAAMPAAAASGKSTPQAKRPTVTAVAPLAAAPGPSPIV